MTAMIRLLVVASTLFFVGNSAWAAPKKKYHFELAAVTAKGEVKPDVGKAATPRVELQVKKAFESHPQLVSKLDGAPAKDQADAYRKFLVKKGLAAAFLVTVEVTEATEEIVPTDKPNTQRLVVHVGQRVRVGLRRRGRGRRRDADRLQAARDSAEETVGRSLAGQ